MHRLLWESDSDSDSGSSSSTKSSTNEGGGAGASAGTMLRQQQVTPKRSDSESTGDIVWLKFSEMHQNRMRQRESDVRRMHERARQRQERKQRQDEILNKEIADARRKRQQSWESPISKSGSSSDSSDFLPKLKKTNSPLLFART